MQHKLIIEDWKNIFKLKQHKLIIEELRLPDIKKTWYGVGRSPDAGNKPTYGGKMIVGLWHYAPEEASAAVANSIREFIES